MKKKILIIVLPIVLVLIFLTGILSYVYLPPKGSNFRIDLQVDDIGFDDEITLISDDKSGNMVLSCKTGKTLNFRMLFMHRDRREYKTVYRGETFMDIEISLANSLVYSPDRSETHELTLPNIKGLKLAWSIDNCTRAYTFEEKGIYTIVAKSFFRTKGREFTPVSRPVTVVVGLFDS